MVPRELRTSGRWWGDTVGGGGVWSLVFVCDDEDDDVRLICRSLIGGRLAFVKGCLRKNVRSSFQTH